MTRFNRAGLVAAATLGATTLVAGAAEYALERRGDADIHLEVQRAHGFTFTSIEPEYAVVRFSIPFGNRGRQQGCVLDCTGRVLPDGDRWNGLDVEVRVSNSLLPRTDGYFEAIMYKKKDPLELNVELHVRGKQPVAARLQEIGIIGLEFHHSFYMRSPLRNRRTTYNVVLGRNFTSLGSKRAESSPTDPVTGSDPAAGSHARTATMTERKVGVAVPVRTHILTPRDRFADVVEKYIVPVARKGDVVAIAESALAIMQGRLYHVEDIAPRWWARKLCRVMGADSSLSTPYGMEMAFRVCGTKRMFAAIVAGVAGKALGRDGDFYRVAGPDVATIDDASGTLPPFDKHVVLGPVDCREVVDDIKKRFGFECAVVDANDLQKCAVLAISDPSLAREVERTLLHNPQGNGGEQTPILFIPRAV